MAWGEILQIDDRGRSYILVLLSLVALEEGCRAIRGSVCWHFPLPHSCIHVRMNEFRVRVWVCGSSLREAT